MHVCVGICVHVPMYGHVCVHGCVHMYKMCISVPHKLILLKRCIMRLTLFLQAALLPLLA